MDKLLPSLILMSLFLASDVASQVVDQTTPLATDFPPELPSDSRTDSKFVASKGTRGDGVIDERTSTDLTQEAAETTIPNRTFKSTSVQGVSKVHLGWPTASTRTNFSSDAAVKAFLVGSSPAEGDTITFSCVVYDPTILTVSWYKVERLSTHDILAPAADIQRMSISHDASDDARRVFNLTIEFLHSDDSGEYTCRGINRPDAAATVDITVRYVPELHYPECYLNGKRQAIVLEGDTLNFECRSEKGIPPWHLIWFRQLNKSIDVISTSIQDRSEMIFSEHSVVASRELTGATFMCSLVCLSHECLKTNNNGPRNCNIGPLIVNPRPPPSTTPIITIDPGMPIASEGDDIEFECSTSLEDGNAVWFPVGGEPPPEDHIIVSGDGSHMAIKNVRVNDTDLMACGVFCQEKLITVRQVNMDIIRKPVASPEPTTREAPSSSSTTTSPQPAVLTVTDRLSNSAGNRDEQSNRELQEERRAKISTPIALISMFLILVILLVIVARLRRHSYQRAATEPPDLGSV